MKILEIDAIFYFPDVFKTNLSCWVVTINISSRSKYLHVFSGYSTKTIAAIIVLSYDILFVNK